MSRDPDGVDLEADDPYADVDVDDLPDWWREAVVEFREHRLRPYRPPRFEDGTHKHEVVAELEEEFGVNIDVIGLDATTSDEWTVRVDRRPVGTVGYRREAGGYTVYEVTSHEFRELIRTRVGADEHD